MKTEQWLRPPEMPKPIVSFGRDDSKASDEFYYKRTLEEALAASFKGRKGGLEIQLNEELDYKFKELKAFFEGNFGLSRIICFAYNRLERGFVYRSDINDLANLNSIGSKTVNFKPDRDCIKAIISFKGDDAAPILARAGISMLYKLVISR